MFPRGPVARALSWYAAGMDFGDALHLAGSAPATRCTTVDRTFGKRAKKLATIPPVAIL